MVEDMPYVHIHKYIHTALPQRSNELETKSSIDFDMYSHTYLKLCVCTSDLQELRQFDFFTVGCTDTYIHIVLGSFETQVVSPGFWEIVHALEVVCVFTSDLQQLPMFQFCTMWGAYTLY